MTFQWRAHGVCLVRETSGHQSSIHHRNCMHVRVSFTRYDDGSGFVNDKSFRMNDETSVVYCKVQILIKCDIVIDMLIQMYFTAMLPDNTSSPRRKYLSPFPI